MERLEIVVPVVRERAAHEKIGSVEVERRRTSLLVIHLDRVRPDLLSGRNVIGDDVRVEGDVHALLVRDDCERVQGARGWGVSDGQDGTVGRVHRPHDRGWPSRRNLDANDVQSALTESDCVNLAEFLGCERHVDGQVVSHVREAGASNAADARERAAQVPPA
jgi:hypothetical protein